MRASRRLPAGARVGSFTGLSIRSLRARPLRSLLTTAAVVLGVGMVFGVLLLVGTIHSTFGSLYDSIYGRSDLVVSGEQSIGSLPQRTLDRIRATEGISSASGSVYSVFRRVQPDGDVDRERQGSLYTVGGDFTQPDTSTAEVVAGSEPRAGRREIQLAADWADEQGYEVGDVVRLSTPSGVVALRVSGLYEFAGGLDLGGYGTAAMPIDQARPIMGKPTGWDEINVILDDGASVKAVARDLDATLGRGVSVVTPDTKSDELDDSLASLDIVLYFFSGIALFVGGFLILNSFNMTVFQRMREIGTLRALGASEGRVARSVLAESAVLGTAGSVLGLAVGAGLAVLLVEGMKSFGMPLSTVDYSATAAVAAVVTGMLATLVGAAWPAVRASRIPPITALVGGGAPRRKPGLARALVGLALFLPGLLIGGLYWFGDTSSGGFLAALVGIGSTMVMFVGMVRLAPFVVLPLVRLLARPVRRAMPAEGRLAADAALANPGRTAATAATLLVALSVVVVNATMASSFVGSVEDELDSRFARDVTVQTLGYQDFGPPQSGLSDRLRRQIERMPEAGEVARRRVVYLPEMPGGGQEGLAIAYEPYEYDRVDSPDYEGAPRDEVLAGLAGGGIAVAKTHAESEGLEVGDQLRLTGPSGVRRVPIVAIADTLDGGGHSIQMSLATMAAVYGWRVDAQLAVKAASPDQREALADRIDALLEREYPGMEALSNAEVKQETEDAISQQFGFFNAIVAMAVLVGVLGIVNTLSMSVLERTREIGVLRALGASRWRVRRAMADESLLISIAGTLAGIGAGLLVGLVWIVAMRESTFPGLSLHLPVGMLVSIAVLGVVVGVLAAILPARRAAKLDPLGALRYE